MSSRRDQENDPEQLADALEREADDAGERSDALEEKVIEVRREWEQKRSDSNVPGAVPPDPDAAPEGEEGQSSAPEAPPEDAETNIPPSDSS